ncbi:MAG: prolyl oligopeptidase family serine peptidase [Candidatus Bathycorpusculaceae bacterium]
MAGQALDNVEKVLKIPDLILGDLSKNGRFALFLTNVSGSYQLWSIDMQKGSTNQVSHGDQRVTFAEISPDSQSVVFSRDFGGAERHQLFLAPITGQTKEEQISKLEDVRVFDFAWSPSGKGIALTGSTLEANFLWLFDMESRESQMLYKNKGWIFSPNWSTDSKRVVASAKTTDKPKSAELLLLDVTEKKVEIYTPKLSSENTSPKWNPKRDQIIFKTNALGPYDLAIYDLSSKALTYCGASKLGRDFPFFDWANDGKSLWFVAAKNGRTKLYLQKIGDEPVELPISNGRISNIKLDATSSFFIFSWSSLSQPPMLSKLNLKTKKLTTVYKHTYDESIPLGKAEFLTYKSFDGLEIPAFILFAKGSRKPKPCIVWPHGGPWWEVADEWNAAIQALCVGGFHVFCPNFRGSTGYGSEFERMNIKDPGGGDLQDIVFGVKFLFDKEFVEDEKIAIAGASYGGFMTFLAMTKVPEIWKAGAAIVGVTDWKEMYELSDAAFRSFIEELLGKPEENPELFQDRSAINFVHQIKSPILIWHRANDSRCPLKPIERFVKKLEELKKPHEFHVVEDEGHGPQKINNLVRQYKHVVAFMLKHLK